MAANIRILRRRPKWQPSNFVLLSSFSSSNRQPSKVAYSEEIQKKLADFRSRVAPSRPTHIGGNQSPSPPSSSSKDISLQEIYKRNANAARPSTGKLFDTIRMSLLDQKNDSFSLSNFKDSLRLRQGDPSRKEVPIVIGSDKLHTSMFLKENKDLDNRAAMRQMYVREYNHRDLGEKLRSLRPEHKGKKDWFSLEELNDRLIKLREIEDKESNLGGIYDQLRESLVQIDASSHDNRNSTIRKLDVLSYLGENAEYLSHPPKEHLVEKYFDPGNMSSAEKMKLELKKVRDEFKMSESDCGSARVQVAQLTTKIKHLSGVLHKKDKHSRKGLQAMVQKRKKLLKYLRRTDWESYCLVLSKFGLRDNPDYKN
nr:Ribosomal protein [Ipomoea batatas]